MSNFAVMQVKMLHRIVAALLLCWYLYTVVGFDVHRCCDSDNVYVESLVAGISCEDIHPDVPCHHHHHDACCCGNCAETEDEDCENEIGRLELPGCGDDGTVEVPAPVQMICFIPETVTPFSVPVSLHAACSACTNAPPAPDLSLLCVLRV